MDFRPLVGGQNIPTLTGDSYSLDRLYVRFSRMVFYLLTPIKNNLANFSNKKTDLNFWSALEDSMYNTISRAKPFWAIINIDTLTIERQSPIYSKPFMLKSYFHYVNKYVSNLCLSVYFCKNRRFLGIHQ